MNIAKFVLPLWLSLLAAPVLAQDANGPGKVNPNGMSDQDYERQRQKILKRINPQQVPPTAEHKTEPPRGTYGQGYGSRKGASDAVQNKPAEKPGRPERPRVERPGRP